MIQAGSYYTLKIVKLVDFGAYLDADGIEVLLPKRYLPKGVKEGDEVRIVKPAGEEFVTIDKVEFR